ncbi:MAG: arylesterase [Burkholderiaceae bacterium]|nr:arylesterase [Burkholderiaceae bacterium]
MAASLLVRLAPAALLAAAPASSATPARAEAGSDTGADKARSILILGDSLSAEYGLARGAGWVALLSARLEREQPGRFRVVNASVSGDTSAGGRARLPRLIERHRPALVLIELGANDALRGLDLDATRDNLSAMVRLVKDSGARALVLGMQLPPNYGPDYTASFAAMFGRVADRESTALVPFLLDGFAGDLGYFQADRIHPNARAQLKMLENVWPVLEPLLN